MKSTTRWRGWATAHINRYAARRRRTGVLALTLRRPTPWTARFHTTRRTAWTWAPRVQLCLSHHQVARLHAARMPNRVLALGIHRQRQSGRKPPAGLTGAGLLHRPAHAPVTTGGQSKAIARVTPLRRVFLCASHVRAIAASPAVSTIRPQLVLAKRERVEMRMPVVPRILHRPPREPEAARQASSEFHAPVPPRPSYARSLPDSAAITDAHVNLLAEHVIRQIDRRIVAYRERLGRPA